MHMQENTSGYTVLACKVMNKKALIINWHIMLKRLPTPELGSSKLFSFFKISFTKKNNKQ